jgi:hypothetical protein
MNPAPAKSAPTGMEQAKGKALKTFAVNFILAFAATWGAIEANNWWQARKSAKQTGK